MDVAYFLKERTKFVRQFYDIAAVPFAEIKRKIEESEPPYQPNSWDDSGEPPFQAEWAEADTSLEILGRACASILSAALNLYFKTWEDLLKIQWDNDDRKKAFKKGYIRGYRLCFEAVSGQNWDAYGVDFEMLEQLVLIRNADQHPQHILHMHLTHPAASRSAGKRLFFVHEGEADLYLDAENEGAFWMAPSVKMSRESLFAAIDEIDKLVDCLDPVMLAIKYGWRPASAAEPEG